MLAILLLASCSKLTSTVESLPDSNGSQLSNGGEDAPSPSPTPNPMMPAPAPQPAPAPSPSPATPAVTWISCAREGQACNFTGRRQVRYLAATGVREIIKVAEGSVNCVDSSFGAAATTYENLCSYSNVTTTAPVTVSPSNPPTSPAPQPAPAPTPAPTPSPAPSPAPSPSPSSGAVGPRIQSFNTVNPITATSNQIISGVRISNPNGPCITVPGGVTGVVIRDSEIGPCEGNANIIVYGNNTLIEYVYVHDGARGVLTDGTNSVITRFSKFHQFHGPAYKGTAIEYDHTLNGVIEGNLVTGRAYASDAVSFYESSNAKLINNTIDIDVEEPSSAAFTMGDSTTNNPGANNYVAGNKVYQTGGVPAGVFGSSGNTILEKNCLTHGIQAYNYSGTFVGVTVRQNVIDINSSFVPDTSVISGWSTNINSKDCSLVPK